MSIEQNEKNKENTHAFLVRPCSVNLKQLNIGKNKQYTVQENMEDEVDIVDKQPKKKTTSKRKNISDIGKEIQNIMPNDDDRYVCPKKRCSHDYGIK